MTSCWPEGALRAYLDRELPAADMKAVAAHLGECSACDALCTELAGRAARVFALLEALPEPETIRMRPAPVPPRAPSRWLWPGAAVALAAGLAIASLVIPKRETPPIQQLVNVAPPPAAPPVLESVPQTLPAAVSAPAAQPVVAKIRRPQRAASADMDYFVALDDEPIESGVIMRMALQPGDAQADIVFDPAGRARAIRLVSSKH